MALKLFVHDTTSGACELAGLVPYPKVTTTDPTVTVTPVVAADGSVDYQLAVDHTVDINVDNFAYDPATQDIALTETDGTVHTINVSDLLDGATSAVSAAYTSGNLIAKHSDGAGTTVGIYESVTSVAIDGPGFTHTAEGGVTTTITLCDMASNLVDNGTLLGG